MTLPLSDVLHLQDELRQFSKEELTLGTKYHLERYLEEIKAITTPVETQRNELIKKLSNGTGTIPGQVTDDQGGVKPNPVMREFTEQFSALLTVEVELPLYDFKVSLESIEDLKSTNTYPLIFKHFVYSI